MSGCGLSHESAEDRYKGSWMEFEHNPREQGIWYIYGTHKFTVTSREFNSVANQLKVHLTNNFFLKELVTHPTNQLVNDTLDCSSEVLIVHRLYMYVMSLLTN